jgi:hypothetical protein
MLGLLRPDRRRPERRASRRPRRDSSGLSHPCARWPVLAPSNSRPAVPPPDALASLYDQNGSDPPKLGVTTPFLVSKARKWPTWRESVAMSAIGRGAVIEENGPPEQRLEGTGTSGGNLPYIKWDEGLDTRLVFPRRFARGIRPSEERGQPSKPGAFGLPTEEVQRDEDSSPNGGSAFRSRALGRRCAYCFRSVRYG